MVEEISKYVPYILQYATIVLSILFVLFIVLFLLIYVYPRLGHLRILRRIYKSIAAGYAVVILIFAYSAFLYNTAEEAIQPEDIIGAENVNGVLLFDMSHGQEESLYEDFYMLKNELQNRGFRVEPLYGALNANSLEFCDVLVIANPQNSYSDEEKQNIVQFVKDGRTLILIGNNNNGITINDLATLFNTEMIFFGVCDPTDYKGSIDTIIIKNFKEDPLFRDVTSILLDNCCYLPTAEGIEILAQSDGDSWVDVISNRALDPGETVRGEISIITQLGCEKGIVVLMCSSYPLTNIGLEEHDNKKFVLNLFRIKQPKFFPEILKRIPESELTDEGEIVEIYIDIANNSDIDIHNIQINEVIPPEFSIYDTSGNFYLRYDNVITWRLEEIKSGETKNFHIKAKLDEKPWIYSGNKIVYTKTIVQAYGEIEWEVKELKIHPSVTFTQLFGTVLIQFLMLVLMVLGYRRRKKERGDGERFNREKSSEMEVKPEKEESKGIQENKNLKNEVLKVLEDLDETIATTLREILKKKGYEIPPEDLKSMLLELKNEGIIDMEEDFLPSTKIILLKKKGT